MEQNSHQSLNTILEEIQEHYDAGQVEQAEEAIDKAYSLNSRDPEALNRLGELLMAAGHHAKAREIFLKLVLIAPTVDSQLSLAASCINSNWEDHAAILLDRILESGGDEPLPVNVYHMRAGLFMVEEEWDKALDIYEVGLKEYGDDHDLLAGSLKAVFSSGEVTEETEIEALCEKILELEPEHTEARKRLESIQDAREEAKRQAEQEKAEKTRKFSFWQSPEYDSDCGIPEERIPVCFLSVVVPVCNHEALLRDHLESLMEQTIAQGIEIIVVNHGSSENEESIVEFFQDNRFPVAYVEAGDCERVEAMNRGVKVANGEYVMFSTPGDTLRPDAAVRFVKAIRSEEEVKVAYSDWASTRMPNDDFATPQVDKVFRHQAFDSRNILRVPVATGPVMVEREWLSELLFFHTDKQAAFHEFILRTVIGGGGVISIPEVLELRYARGEEAIAAEAREIKDIRLSYVADFPIEKIYRIDASDPYETASAWVAYGNWMLEEVQCPGEKYPSDEMELAAICFEKALEFSPAHEAAIQNLTIVASALGNLEEVLSNVEKMPVQKREQLLADIDTYRRNFTKVEMIQMDRSHSYEDDWTSKSNSIPGLDAALFDEDPAANAMMDHAELEIQSPIRWVGSFFAESPESAAGIEWAHSLFDKKKVGICHTGSRYSRPFVHSLPSIVRQRLFTMNEKYGELNHGIAIYQGIDSKTRLLPDADYHVGVAFSQSSRLTNETVRMYNQLDEVWVANSYLREVLLSSGVEQRKIQWMPLCVDDYFFKPGNSSSWVGPKPHETQLLTVVDDPQRCGLDLLLKACDEQFSEDENVGLWIYPSGTEEVREANISAIRKVLAEHGFSTEGGESRVEILTEEVAWREMPSLINSCSAVVLPYRHEAFGMEVARAICCERPVISVNHGGVSALSCSGNLDLISFKLIDAPEGSGLSGNWVEPSFDELKDRLTSLVSNFEISLQKAGAAATEFTQAHGHYTLRERLEDRLYQIEDKLLNPTLDPVPAARLPRSGESTQYKSSDDEVGEAETAIIIQGSHKGYDSISNFNRHFANALEADTSLNIQAREGDEDSASSESGITIRNQTDPQFAKPSRGRWIHMADWTLSRIPQEWVSRLAHADEIWATSEFQRRAYVDSGIDPARLVMIPVGVDTKVFNTEVAPMELDGKKVYRYIFVGNGQWSSGADLLMAAYYQTFKGKTNVELVVVDTETGAEKSALKSLVDQFASKMGAPSISYHRGDYSDDEYASLYRACHCFVYPYRSESMGLRVLEAMACGLPVIVTGGGATDDFVADEYGYRVPSVRRWVGSQMSQAKLVGRGYFLEADVLALGAEMTHVLYHKSRAAAMGSAAAKWVAESRTWNAATSKANDRLSLLLRKPLRKESDSGHSTQFNQFWKQFEKLVESNSIQDGWEYMLESVRQSPFNPDAFHGLLQLAHSRKWNTAANSIQQWMNRWMPDEVAHDICKVGIEAGSGEVEPEWLKLPDVIREVEQMPKLTVILEGSTFDERLEETLEPLGKIAHQIIISGSDSSPDFALLEELEAEWQSVTGGLEDSEQRNRLIEKATGDWILFLLPGEKIRESQLDQLVHAMMAPGVAACAFPRMVKYSDEKRTRELALRLFRNVPGLYFAGNSYEALSEEWEAFIKRWDLHISHEVLYIEANEKSYSTLSERDAHRRSQLETLVARHPSDSRLRLNLAEELESVGQTSDAEEQYSEILKLVQSNQPDANTPAILENTYTNLGYIYLRNGEYEKLINLYSHTQIRKSGLTSSMHYLKGKAFLELGETDEAVAEFTKSLEKKHLDTYSLPLNDIESATLEDKIQEELSGAGYPVVAKEWDRVVRNSGRSSEMDLDASVDDGMSSGHDLVPLS